MIEYFHSLHAVRDAHFGNARLVRNAFEMMVTAQASRLVNGPPPDSATLVLLTSADLDWPSGLADVLPPRDKRRYQVVCPACGEAYSWKPDMDLVDAQCTQCKAIYDATFGDVLRLPA